MPNPPTADQLRQQLLQLQQTYASRPQTGVGMSGIRRGQREQDQYVSKQLDLSGRIASAGGPGGAESRDRVEANRDKMYGLADGRLGEMRNDPVDAEIMAAMRGRATGADVPFNETTTNAMFTARAEQGAASQGAAVNRLLQSGLSPGDPAFASALAEMESDRQGSMQNARMNVDMNAGQQNYAARGGALAQMSGMNAQRQGAITNQSNYLSNLYGNETVYEQGGGAGGGGQGGGMPSFQDFRQVGQPQAQPRPQARPSAGFVAPNQPGRQYNVGTGSLGATSGAVASDGGTFGSTYGGAPSAGPARPPTWTATNARTGAARTGQNPSLAQSPMIAPLAGRLPPRPAIAPQRNTRTMGY